MLSHLNLLVYPSTPLFFKTRLTALSETPVITMEHLKCTFNCRFFFRPLHRFQNNSAKTAHSTLSLINYFLSTLGNFFLAQQIYEAINFPNKIFPVMSSESVSWVSERCHECMVKVEIASTISFTVSKVTEIIYTLN